MREILQLKQQFDNKEEIILRDFLALERTRLANERTLLSYLRTAVYMAVATVAFLEMEQFAEIRWIGYVTIALGIGFLLMGVLRFLMLRRSIAAYYAGPGAHLESEKAAANKGQ